MWAGPRAAVSSVSGLACGSIAVEARGAAVGPCQPGARPVRCARAFSHVAQPLGDLELSSDFESDKAFQRARFVRAPFALGSQVLESCVDWDLPVRRGVAGRLLMGLSPLHQSQPAFALALRAPRFGPLRARDAVSLPADRVRPPV